MRKKFGREDAEEALTILQELAEIADRWVQSAIDLREELRQQARMSDEQLKEFCGSIKKQEVKENGFQILVQ